jgi:glyoxylase-like metal-dependent hydrolase (beta-lactamase superfamily II)
VPVVDRLELGAIGTNCYVVRSERGAPEAVVVDPSGSAAEIRLALASMGTRCAAILLTHGHWDHVVGVADLAEGTGAPVHMAEDERVLLEEPGAFAPPGVTVRAWTPDVLLRGGETLELAGVVFEVLAVPGHSPAHLAYHADGVLLSGDVLFAGSVGRTDIPGADWAMLLSSIRLLVERCPPETVVHPGHGPATTLGAELASNPFLGELRAELREEADQAGGGADADGTAG